MTTDVAALVRAAQAGDRAALDALLGIHLPLLYNVIGRALNGHADVDDLVQETLLRVVRGLPALRDPTRFRSWAVAIAYRQVQRHTRMRRAEELPEDPPDPRADFSERTVTELVLTGQRREIAEAARWLDDGDRDLLALWWQEAAGVLTRAEVAAALGITAAHAAVRIQRMRTRLESVRAVVRALRAKPICDALCADWDGRIDPLWRKRFIRHVRECPVCARFGRGLVAPEKLLPGVVPVPAPSFSTGFLEHKVAVLAAAAVLVAGGGFTFAVHETPWDPGSAVLSNPSPSPSTFSLYVAPNGSDAAPGTLDRPFATLGKAVAVVRPGQTIALRGGVYRPTRGVVITVSGTASKRITLTNYRDERPVIDAADVPADKWTVTHRADYWTVRGLEVMNSRSHAYVCISCRGTVFQRLSMHHNQRSGLTLRDPGTIGNQVLDSDFHHNYDPDEPGTAGIGLGIKFGDGEGNVIRGCRAFNNADSGFDVGHFGNAVTLEHNWSYGNGVNRWNAGDWHPNADGFLLGGGDPAPVAAHVLRHNAAWNNHGDGFDEDDGTPGGANLGALDVRNNTSFHNGGTAFALGHGPAMLADNAADDSTFHSTDPTTAAGPRQPDGRLPVTDFLVTGSGIGASMTPP
ncbi:sigma-70 family RNA polymerase sigma factor [Virgisporangium aurantiacum]|uniref:RNA polymerase sigma factor, sigma-70 family n=1 Tax=Virgisporangium aurantiacum TaxID=175570 RepID=A0A8J3YX54_9ACTN|nr:sigma-70 family RNA polymerase sigma factor [Virgisporangium aurantiacum]GIJ53236.1 hypothetical protein Vau01_007520 [Virgisporangium aurantiacum]